METILTPASIDRFLDSLCAEGCSPLTIKAYRSDLYGFAIWAETTTCPTTASKPTSDQPKEAAALAADYLNTHRASWSPATAGRRVTSIRRYLVDATGDATILASYRSPKIGTRPPHPLPEGMNGVWKMYEAAVGHQHQALIVLCGALGLRVSEALAVTVDDFDEPGDCIILTVRGKGDKTRFIPVPPKTWALLEDAVTFSIRQRWATVVNLADRGARQAINRIGQKALGHPVASHDLRMTFGTTAYANTHDIRAVQEVLGHASSATTEGYTHVGMDAKKAATDVS
jgi:site-specific recombinase XerD